MLHVQPPAVVLPAVVAPAVVAPAVVVPAVMVPAVVVPAVVTDEQVGAEVRVSRGSSGHLARRAAGSDRGLLWWDSRAAASASDRSRA